MLEVIRSASCSLPGVSSRVVGGAVQYAAVAVWILPAPPRPAAMYSWTVCWGSRDGAWLVEAFAGSLCSTSFLGSSSSLLSSKDGRPSLVKFPRPARAVEERPLGGAWKEGSRERERERDIFPAPPRPVEYYEKVYVSIQAPNEWEEKGRIKERMVNVGKGCTYKVLSLLGISLSGVLTLKSKSVLDSSSSISGSGTKVPSASATSGGHLEGPSDSPASIKG